MTYDQLDDEELIALAINAVASGSPIPKEVSDKLEALHVLHLITEE